MKIVIKYPLFLLLAITVICFSPTLFNGFQKEWDDTWQVLENPFISDQSFPNMSFHFTNFYRGQYSPVNTLMYMLVYRLSGFDPLIFHLASLLIHLTNVSMAFYLIRNIVKTAKQSFNFDRVQLYAFFCALIFAIHPLQVESVAWISASKVLMFSFFFFLSFLCYIKYIQTSKILWMIIVSILYCLGFASKEQAIILPLNLLALDYIYGRLKWKKSLLSFFKETALLEKVPFILMALCFWYFSSSNNLGLIDLGSYPTHHRIMFGFHSVMEYIFRAVAPVKLYFFYFFPMRIGAPLPWFYWGYPILVSILVLFGWYNISRHNRLVIFGLLIFIINLLLVLHILPLPRPNITADRYMYISIIGLALIAIRRVDYLLIKFKSYRNPILSVIIVYFLFYSGHTFYRTMQWKDSKTMKKNVTNLIEERLDVRDFAEEYLLIKKHEK